MWPIIDFKRCNNESLIKSASLKAVCVDKRRGYKISSRPIPGKGSDP